MNDEQLRKFCLERAIILFNEKSDTKAFNELPKSDSLFDIANALFNYIKSGEETEIPFFLRKDVLY